MWIIYYKKNDIVQVNSDTFYVNFHTFKVCLCFIVVYFSLHAEARALEVKIVSFFFLSVREPDVFKNYMNPINMP